MNRGDGLSRGLLAQRLRWRSKARIVLLFAILASLWTIASSQEAANEDSSSRWMTRGHELFLFGSYQEAAMAYTNATALNPENADAWLGVGDSFKFILRNQEALTAIDQALKIDGDYADAWCSKGYVLSNMGRKNDSDEAYRRALDLYQERLDRNPKDALAWKGKGLALGYLMAFGSDDLTGLEKAIQAFDMALEIDDADPETYLHKANGLWILATVRGEPDLYNQSLDCLDRAILLDPHYAEAWRIKGMIYQEMGRHEDALESFEKALETAFQMTWALVGIAQSLAELDRGAESEQFYSQAVETLLRTVESASSSQEESQAWYMMGNILWMQGRQEEALSAMDNSTLAYPNDCLTWMAKADLLASTYRYSQSLTAYDGAIQAIEADPEGSICRLSDAYFRKGDVLLAAGRIGEARLAFEEASSLDPESPYIWVAMGDCLRADGMYQGALEAYDRAIEMAEASSSMATSGIAARAWYMSGLTERQLGHGQEADRSIARAVDLGFSLPLPMTQENWVDDGLGHHENGSYDMAVHAFHQAISQEPRNATIWFYKGNSFYALAIDSGFQEGIFQGAIDAYNRSIELNRTYAQPWWGMARALDLRGVVLGDLARAEEIKLALAAIGNALDIDPYYGEGWVYKGSILDEMGSLTGNTSWYNESIQAFNMALEVAAADDTSVQALAWEGRALSLTHLGNHLADTEEEDEARSIYQEALGYYDRAIDLDPNFTGLEARINKASVLEELGRYDEAVSLLDQALAAVPENLSIYAALLWAYKGSVLDEMGQHQEALRALENATSLDPENAIAWRVKGDVLRDLGQSSEAAAAYSKARELGLDPLGGMIAIAKIAAEGEDEFVEIVNNLDEAISLEGWTLVVDEDDTLTVILPGYTLEPAGKVRIHFGAGEDTETDLFTNSEIDLVDTATNVTLRDEAGREVSFLGFENVPDGVVMMRGSGEFEYQPSSQ